MSPLNSVPEGRELEISGSWSACSYLPDRLSRMHYRIATSLSTARYEHLLERGWRRFGRTLFRPVCGACQECRSLRIDIAAFQPTKSQRRIRNRNAELELIVQRPTVTTEHLELYNVYHQDMHERRDWPYSAIERDRYQESFLDGRFEFSREFQYRLNNRLIAVGLVDVTPRVMSSIYFFYDPEFRDQSPGTMSVLRELEVGRSEGRQWLYMGYYIQDCISMNYKNRFHPHEFLQAYVADDAEAVWQRPSDLTESAGAC
jgi:leucyl-tRNA---protein transferase